MVEAGRKRHAKAPVRDMALVADIAASWLEATSGVEVCARLEDGLRRIVGDDVILCVSGEGASLHHVADPAAAGRGPLVDKVLALAGREPGTATADLPPAVKRVMATGRLTRIREGVAGLTRGVVSVEVARAAQELAGIRAVHVVGFRCGETRGGIFILTGRPGVSAHRAAVELLARLAAGAMEHQRVRAAMRQDEERHRAVLDNLADVIVQSDCQGRCLYVSPSLEGVTGVTPPGRTGRTVRDLGFPEDASMTWETAFRCVLESGQPVELEFPVQGRQGPVTLSWRLVPEKDARGNVRSVLSMARDVTAQRKLEQDYQTLFREMLDGCALHEIILDGQGQPVDYRFLAVNPAFERITGLKSEEVVGRTVLQVLPDTERHWIDTYGRVALTGVPTQFDNFSVELGKYFEVRAFRPAPGQFACIFVDVTERRRAAQERERLQSHLAQAQKMEAIGTLAGGVAHDFNNILGGLLGGLSLMEAELGDRRDLLRDVTEMKGLVDRGAELARQLLGFARRGKVLVKPQDLGRVVERTCTMFGRTRKDITIQVDLAPGLLAVLMDHAQLERVLLNLFLNAGVAMPGGGRLMVRAANHEVLVPSAGLDVKPGRFVELVVADTGVGMDSATQARVFEPFFTTGEPGQGTGLGLASVYGIVNGHGGATRVESALGQGTTFTLLLPAAEKAAWEPAVPPPPVHVGRGTVLVVDDEEHVLRVCARLLAMMGYEALTARGGKQALEVAREHGARISVVMLDLTMPEMSGSRTYDALREVLPHAKVLLSSGHGVEGQAQEILARGCHAFIQKPFDAAALSAKLQGLF